MHRAETPPREGCPGLIELSQRYRCSAQSAKHWSTTEKICAERAGAMAAYDLCFVVDGTASMQHFLAALNQSLPQFMQLTRVVDAIDRVGLLVYRDYNSSPVHA